MGANAFGLDLTTSKPSLFNLATDVSLLISESNLPLCLLGVFPVVIKYFACWQDLLSSCTTFQADLFSRMAAILGFAE